VSDPPPINSQPPPPSVGGEDVPVFDAHVNWSPGDAVLGVLMALAILIAGGLVIFPITGDDGLDVTLAGMALTEVALVSTAWWFASRRGHAKPFSALGVRAPRKGWLRTAAGGYGLYFLCVIVIVAVVGEPEQTDVADTLGFDENTAAAILAALLIIVIAPVCEEIFFRGFFFAGLRSRLPFWVAALVSAVLFGAVHLGEANLVAGLQLTVLGVILAGVYERTDSLWSNIAVHAFNNAIAFTLLVST